MFEFLFTYSLSLIYVLCHTVCVFCLFACVSSPLWLHLLEVSQNKWLTSC